MEQISFFGITLSHRKQMILCPKTFATHVSAICMWQISLEFVKKKFKSFSYSHIVGYFLTFKIISQTLLQECDVFISNANNVLRVLVLTSKTRAMDKKSQYRKIWLSKNRLDIHISKYLVQTGKYQPKLHNKELQKHVKIEKEKYRKISCKKNVKNCRHLQKSHSRSLSLSLQKLVSANKSRY